MRRWSRWSPLAKLDAVVLALCALAFGAVVATAQVTAPAQVNGCVFNSVAPVLSTGQSVVFQCDQNGQLKISGTINATSAATATAAAPSYVEGSSDAFSMDLSGNLRTLASVSLAPGSAFELLDSGGVNKASISAGGALKVDNSAVTQPVSGTITANQGGTWTVQPGNTANTTAWLATPVPTAGKGCTPYHLAGGTAASTNSTSVKGSAGTVCHLLIINTTATVYYLKIYDSASAPTCSSATNIKHVYPIPALSTGAGFAVSLPMGEAYANGIGYCVTGGGGDTDNTNAATGVYIEGSYS